MHQLPNEAVTHNGRFHADDVFSAALLKILNPEIHISRVSAVPENFSGIVFDLANGTFDHHNSNIKYRNNGKTVQLRTNWKNATEDKPNLRVKASCNKNDDFNFETGLDIADYRMQIKYLQRKLEDMLDRM